MRTTVRLLPLLAVLAAAPALAGYPPASAAASAPAAASADTEALHNELRAVRDAMQTAMNSRNIDGLLAHVTDDVVFTTMNGDRVTGKDGIRAYYRKMMENNGIVKTVTTRFEADALSHLYGGDTAVAFGRSRDRYELATGEVWEVQPKWSATLVRTDGRWLIAEFHYSVSMLDNPVLAAQKKWFAIGGGAAVLLAASLGFWLGRRGRK